MNVDKLVRMANQIGAFFATEPDHAVAVESVTSHLRRMWEPRMRTELLDHVAATGGAGLSPLVLEAVTANRERLASLTPRNPG